MYSLERKFVLTANDQMQVLEEIWGAGPEETANAASLQKGTGQETTITALHSIKFAANSVQARGVYRAANFCETIYTSFDYENGAKLRGSLAGLKSLIFQYADGLFEIDPEFKASVLSRKVEKTDHLKVVPVNDDQEEDVEKVCLQAQHTQSKKTLKPLLLLVKSESQQQALETLMKFEAVQNEMPAPSSKPKPRLTVQFENLMRPITNLALSEARHSAKKLSVSYAADFEELALSSANRIQEFLEILCLSIVANGVPANRSTQISLTGQEKDNKHVFNINWRGHSLEKNAAEDPHFKRAVASLRAEGGDIQFRKLAIEAPVTDLEAQEPVMQTLEVTFVHKRTAKKAANLTNALKSESQTEVLQGATG